MSELKPCPFCGEEPERHTTARNRRHSVGCKGCNIYFMGPEEYKAAAAWNQRTTEPRELRHRMADVWGLLDTMARQAGVDTNDYVDDLLDPKWSWLMNALMEYRIPDPEAAPEGGD